MTFHTITPAVGTVCRCKAKAGLSRSPQPPYTNTIVITAEVESGFIVKITLFHSAAFQFPRARHHFSRAAHVMGAAIPIVLQPGAFVWFEKTQGSLMKVLPVPGWWPMKQSAVRVHFLRCGGLLND
ncbi:e3 ubiquitin-protein ligase RNF13 [Trichonephila clavipes]|nr:e3 ubiquitin-protein ligase RNF13 [Trichonephila clavipes]